MRTRSRFALSALGVAIALGGVLSVGVAAAQVPVASQVPAAAQAAVPALPTLTVDEIVAKHVASKGGVEKWKAVQSQKMTGVAIAQGFELPVTIYARRPNQSRQELFVELPGQPAVTIVTMFDGAAAWMINPMTGSPAPQAMTDAETAAVKAQADFEGPLVDYRAKGYTVTVEAPTAVAGKQAHHLKVARKDLPTQHFYLDPELFVELRITTDGVVASDADMSDYKAVDGIMVPHNIRISQGGSIQAEMKILKVEFNAPMTDALFRVK